MAKDSNQLTLSLFNSTSLSGGLTLDGGGFRPSTDLPEEDEAPAVAAAPAIPAQDFVLRGDRQLAHGWKARAADNLAAIRLALEIEAEKRNATPEEQDVLSRFVGFGARDLADMMFRRAGETFAEGWEDLGEELERLVPREELASLARATQYAHYTPEFIIRAIWRARPAHGLCRRRDPGARMRDRALLLPHAGSASPANRASPASRWTPPPRGSPLSCFRTPGSGARISPRRASPRASSSSSAIRRSATGARVSTEPSASTFRCMIISSRGRSSG